MNVKLLKRIQRAIKRRPAQFNMDRWFSQHPNVPHCGTTACLAGWALTLDARKAHQKASPLKAARQFLESCGERQRTYIRVGGLYNFRMVEQGAMLLEISKEQAEKLFFVHNWPSNFRNEYQSNVDFNHQLKAAQIVSDRIDHFIKTDGKE